MTDKGTDGSHRQRTPCWRPASATCRGWKPTANWSGTTRRAGTPRACRRSCRSSVARAPSASDLASFGTARWAPDTTVVEVVNGPSAAGQGCRKFGAGERAIPSKRGDEIIECATVKHLDRASLTAGRRRGHRPYRKGRRDSETAEFGHRDHPVAHRQCRKPRPWRKLGVKIDRTHVVTDDMCRIGRHSGLLRHPATSRSAPRSFAHKAVATRASTVAELIAWPAPAPGSSRTRSPAAPHCTAAGRLGRPGPRERPRPQAAEVKVERRERERNALPRRQRQGDRARRTGRAGENRVSTPRPANFWAPKAWSAPR